VGAGWRHIWGWGGGGGGRGVEGGGGGGGGGGGDVVLCFFFVCWGVFRCFRRGWWTELVVNWIRIASRPSSSILAMAAAEWLSITDAPHRRRRPTRRRIGVAATASNSGATAAFSAVDLPGRGGTLGFVRLRLRGSGDVITQGIGTCLTQRARCPFHRHFEGCRERVLTTTRLIDVGHAHGSTWARRPHTSRMGNAQPC